MVVTHREIPLARERIIVGFPAGGANITAAGLPPAFRSAAHMLLMRALDTIFVFAAIVRQLLDDLIWSSGCVSNFVSIRSELYNLPHADLVHFNQRSLWRRFLRGVATVPCRGRSPMGGASSSLFDRQLGPHTSPRFK